MESENIFDGKSEICVRLNRRWLIPAAVLTVSLLILLIMTSVYLIRGYHNVRYSKQILQENTILKDRILVLNTELDSIMIRLELMERWEDEIRNRENYREINKEVREMGTGGLPPIEKVFSKFDKDFQLEYSMLTTKLTHLRSKVYFDYETHQELRYSYHLREDIYRSTPSIYPTFGRLSSNYGFRIHPISRRRALHSGIDISNKQGTPIYATADGEVIEAGWDGLFGNCVKIRHNFGFVTLYGHLRRYVVNKGYTVHKGEIIGEMGSTGYTTGPHLHYEVLRYNRNRNPMPYLVKNSEEIGMK
jgi:murein DD-endopeptidase MepM/ murein hydrolase activator NlpD